MASRSLSLVLLIAFAAFFSGCVCQPLDPYLPSFLGGTGVSSNDTGGSGTSVVCNTPYIRIADGCCLDVNENMICDADENPAVSTTETTQTTLQQTATTIASSTTQKTVTSTSQPTSTTIIRCRTSKDCGVESSYKKCYLGDVVTYYETPKCSHPGQPSAECIKTSRIEPSQMCMEWQTCINATCVNTTYETVTTTTHPQGQGSTTTQPQGQGSTTTSTTIPCDYRLHPDCSKGYCPPGQACVIAEATCYCQPTTSTTSTTIPPSERWYCCKLGGTYQCYSNACPVDAQYGPWVMQAGPFASEYACGTQACFKYCSSDRDCLNGYKCFRWGENSECRRVCTDSDGGINYLVKGTCTDWHTPGDFTDWCTPSLLEYYCAPTRYKWSDGTTVYECTGEGSGCDCTDGACPNWYDVSQSTYWVHYDSLVGGSPIRMRGKFSTWNFISSSSTSGSQNYATLKVTVSGGASGSKEIQINGHQDINLDSFMQQYNGKTLTITFQSKFASGYVRETSIYSGTVAYP
ncbi:MAG: hypothetical protein NTU61_00335 [Candidatus Altiarchaeota archaeon]|nr:hypothetical protein [Candidatus Altiarchaeota archaeon]